MNLRRRQHIGYAALLLPLFLTATANAEQFGFLNEAFGGSRLKLEVTREVGASHPLPATIALAKELPVTGIRFSADGKLFASATGDGNVKLWDAAKRAPLATLSGIPEWNTSGAIGYLQFSSDNKWLFVGAGSGLLVRWSLADDQTTLLYNQPNFSGDGFAVSHDLKHFAYIGNPSTTLFTSDGKPVKQLTIPGVQPAGGLVAEFSRNNQHLLTVFDSISPKATKLSATAALWDWANGKLLWQQEFAGQVDLAAISPDGRQVTVISGERLALPSQREATLTRFELETGNQLSQTKFKAIGDQWRFSRDGSLLLIVGVNNGPAAMLRDTETGTPLQEIANSEYETKPEVGDLSLAAGLLVLGDGQGNLHIRQLEGLPANNPAVPATDPPAAEPPVTERAFRTWASADGQFTLKAKLVSFAKGKVVLEREDGKQIIVAATSLSGADNAFLQAVE